MNSTRHPTEDDDLFGFSPQAPYENPAKKGWTSAMVVDVALGTSDDAICTAYQLQAHELDWIKQDPGFAVQLADVTKELDKDGVTFKLKARLQAEAMLETSWALIHSPATPAAVKAGLIKDTVRWAGYDSPAQDAGGQRAGFSVNIVLNGPVAQGVTYDHPAALPAA